MTYGWALLVVLIVIAALAFFGLLNPNRFLPEKCEIAPGITCLDFTASYSATGTNFTLLINNGLGTQIFSPRLNLSDCDNSDTVYADETWCVNASDSGANHSCMWGSDFGTGSTQKFWINCTGPVANEKFKSDMTFLYNTSVSGVLTTHVKQGYIAVMVEE